MMSGASEYEADLIVAWPGPGIAVIEVKGGQVSRRYGQWFQSSRTEVSPASARVIGWAGTGKTWLALE